MPKIVTVTKKSSDYPPDFLLCIVAITSLSGDRSDVILYKISALTFRWVHAVNMSNSLYLGILRALIRGVSCITSKTAA